MEKLELMSNVLARWGDGSLEITGWGLWYFFCFLMFLAVIFTKSSS